MIGRPGHHTLEMMEKVPCRTSCAPLTYPSLCLFELVRKQWVLSFARGMGSLPLYGGTFARSYSVLMNAVISWVGRGGVSGLNGCMSG